MERTPKHDFGSRQEFNSKREGTGKIAVIDIGSNAVRMGIGDSAHSGGLQTKREPLRLGTESFTNGLISEDTQKKLVSLLKGFQEEIKRLGVGNCRVIGTSALREASNCDSVIRRIYSETSFELELIDGVEEARLIHLAVSKNLDIEKKNALLIDVGGGSVEFICSKRGKICRVESHRIGTVRVLVQTKSHGSSVVAMESFISKSLNPLRTDRDLLENVFSADKEIVFIGTGGNLRALGELAKKLGIGKKANRIKRKQMKTLVKRLSELSIKERMQAFDLRSDRVDVILPAALVVYHLMKMFSFSKILIPSVGLKEGIFYSMREG